MPLGARAAERRVPARQARGRDRDLQRDHRHRRRARAAGRRRRRRGHRLGVDLLDQRPDRAGRGAAGAAQGCARATARHRRSTCPAWRCQRRRVRDRLGARPRQRAPAGGAPRCSARWSPALALVAAFVAWELRAPRADAADALLPHPRASPPATRRSSSRSRSLFSCVFLFAQFLQTVLGYGPLETGLRLMPWTVDLHPDRAGRRRARRPDRRAAADR